MYKNIVNITLCSFWVMVTTTTPEQQPPVNNKEAVVTTSTAATEDTLQKIARFNNYAGLTLEQAINEDNPNAMKFVLAGKQNAGIINITNTDSYGNTLLHKVTRLNRDQKKSKTFTGLMALHVLLHEIKERKDTEHAFHDDAINYRNLFGRTALHYAVLNDFPADTIQAFVFAGADANIKDILGYTPYDYTRVCIRARSTWKRWFQKWLPRYTQTKHFSHITKSLQTPENSRDGKKTEDDIRYEEILELFHVAGL